MKIGLLPLYLKLYDDRVSSETSQKRNESFYALIANELEKRGLSVVTTPICRIASEFKVAVSNFEKAGVDAIVTLHLAYSPSLESAEALASSDLPVIVLDTTPTYSFDQWQKPGELMYNHGIHGVQDMCNLLIRMNKPFVIEAGHWEESDVLNRVLAHVRSASVATAMQNARIGRIGPAFKGMGDFDVAADVLKKTIGIETIDCSTAQLRELLPAPDDKRIDEELAEDQKIFDTSGLPLETHRNSLRIGLAVRNLIERERLTGFSANFMNFNRDDGMPTLPFLEASKAMARGIGYAGEGDVLTSALTGALLSVYPETSFTEMFCPDWKNNTIFLSHMGELNYKLVNGKAKLSEKALPYIPIDPPAVASGCFKAGPACLVNLAPMPEDEFLLLVAPVSMLDIKGKDRMDGMVRGWFKPELPLNDFLAEYSECGGTHHSALTYNVSADELIAFADLMGWDSVIL